jgi:hypothetical protein|tara:strand:+ start:138 stop:311 length:174 start_codon:yes stop_codon:yes gene_type:complete
MSKGDKPRPLSISYKEYSDRYEAIFGKKDDIEEENHMNVIGQNSNDGLHYDKVDGES